MLATITTDLDKIAPRFEIQPDQIEILQTPAEFYQTLKVGHSSPFRSISRIFQDMQDSFRLDVSVKVVLYHSVVICQGQRFSLRSTSFCPVLYGNFMPSIHLR